MNSKKLMKRIVAAMMALVCALSAVVSASAANLSSLAGDMFNSAISKGADVVNAKPATGYWSKNLSRNGQTAYNKILDAVQKYQSSVKLSDNLTSEELKEIPQIIINEHPELFYYDVKKSGAEKSYNENGFVDSYIYHPSYMDNYKQKISEVENAANQILAKAPRNGSDYDKELFKDKTVYCNCDTDHSAFYKYFVDHFEDLGLKKLIVTGIADDWDYFAGTKEGKAYKIEYYGKERGAAKTELKGDHNAHPVLLKDGKLKSL